MVVFMRRSRRVATSKQPPGRGDRGTRRRAPNPTPFQKSKDYACRPVRSAAGRKRPRRIAGMPRMPSVPSRTAQRNVRSGGAASNAVSCADECAFASALHDVSSVWRRRVKLRAPKDRAVERITRWTARRARESLGALRIPGSSPPANMPRAGDYLNRLVETLRDGRQVQEPAPRVDVKGDHDTACSTWIVR